ncbi:copper resistance protein NlpE [Olivibacter sitiensis]|uniref:copper resistance protein NlpE n=1 Tax=Olivibacter sitiensis TaxID=376470 RepID=UPI000484417E|nr:copper resistance protein NlpE [Olivibacter sitiensis]
MKKVKLLMMVPFALCVFMMAACGNAGNNENTVVEIDTMGMVDESLVQDMHNSQNSLDYGGTYKGTIPCADCEGIKTSVQLMDGDAFVMKTEYLGKGDGKEYEEKGTFVWDSTGQIITLNNAEGTLCKYFVGENTLTELDMEGNRIEGPLADKYVLRKD